MYFAWHHAHITVPDRHEAAAWYNQHLSADLRAPTPRSENLYYGTNLVQFQSEAVAEPLQGCSLFALGLGLPDCKAALTRLTEAGARILSENDSITTLLDPWQLRLELYQSDFACQNYLHIHCDDPSALADWYCQHLAGTPAHCSWDSRRKVVEWDTYALHFSKGPLEDQLRTIDHIGWYSRQLQVDYEALMQMGVQFPVPPRAFGQVQLAFLKDPTGIWIELVELPGGVIPK